MNVRDIYTTFFIRAFVLGIPALALVGLVTWAELRNSSYMTGVNLWIDQPVPFSHLHHVQALQIDCRYCHKVNSTSMRAGLPDASVCMTCHSQVWTQAKELEMVRQAYAKGVAIPWKRVNALPDHVYFDHSAHTEKGMSCQECHRSIETMPQTRKTAPLTMLWCMNCHEHPTRETMFFATQDNVNAKVFDKSKQMSLQKKTSCYACHR